jgi:multidrug resistance efflux pump
MALWLAGLALVATGAGGGYAVRHLLAGAPPLQADDSPGAGGWVVCTGHVDVEHGVTGLTPSQPNRVVAVPAREGEVVAAGTVLLRTDDGPARLGLAAGQAAVDAARAQLALALELPGQHRDRVDQQRAAVEVARQRLSAARHVLARKQRWLKAAQLAAEDVAAAEDQVRELEALETAELGRLSELRRHDPQLDVRRAETDLARAEAGLQQARRDLQDCDLKAPQAGTVLRVLAGIGDLVGGPARQPAVLFCPAGPRLVRAEVEQEFAGRVAAGQPARVEDEFQPGVTWRGRVTRVSDWYAQRRSIAREGVPVPDVRTVECLIALDPGQPPVRIGQRVRITIGDAHDEPPPTTSRRG